MRRHRDACWETGREIVSGNCAYQQLAFGRPLCCDFIRKCLKEKVKRTWVSDFRGVLKQRS